jgi:hypothetical protein
MLRQSQRQRAADHPPADNGNFRWLICHGQLSCYMYCVSLQDFLPLEADIRHTGHNRAKAVHYAPCISATISQEQVDDQKTPY